MMKLTHALLAATALAVAGCSTLSTGMGGGDLTQKGRTDQPVLLSWRSHDGGISGTIAATLPGATYQGNFVQITHETRESSLDPLWPGWDAGWGDWPVGGVWNGPYDVERFHRDYTGRVVANLRSDSGRYMRCRFILNEPARGMSAGAQGDCQVAKGETLHAVINRS